MASSYPTDLPEGLLISLKTDIKTLLVITHEVLRKKARMSFYFTLKAMFKLSKMSVICHWKCCILILTLSGYSFACLKKSSSLSDWTTEEASPTGLLCSSFNDTGQVILTLSLGGTEDRYSTIGVTVTN